MAKYQNAFDTCNQDIIMKEIYKHNGNAYVILDKRPIRRFCESAVESPNMEYVQLYMKWRGADHVLSTNTHFLFCKTIQEAEIVP